MGASTKKRGKIQIKNLKKAKKIIFRGEILCVSFGVKCGNLYILNFTFSKNLPKSTPFREKCKNTQFKKNAKQDVGKRPPIQ